MTPQEFRASRESIGLSQTALAKEMGVRRASICDWERGAQPIRKASWLALQYVVITHKKEDRNG
jgi:DNA-binding transcriptional regulator YiaG